MTLPRRPPPSVFTHPPVVTSPIGRLLLPICVLAGLICGCVAPQARLVRAECQAVREGGDLVSVTFISSVETYGLAGRQLVYRVRLINSRTRPIKSTNGIYEDTAGNVAASKTLMVMRSPWTIADVRVSIPAQELEVHADDFPVLADFGIYLPSGERLAQEVAPLPFYRAPALDTAGKPTSRPSAARPAARSAAGKDLPALAAHLIRLWRVATSRVEDWPARAWRAPAARDEGPPASRPASAPAAKQQQGPAAPNVDQPTARPTTHRIEMGESLADIARAHYGDERLWITIWQANPDVDPQHPRAGRVIVLPPREEVVPPAGPLPARERPSSAPADQTNTGDMQYVVKEGDTLTGIAHRLLKDAGRWHEIFELNRDQLASPDLIRAGMELRIPPADSPPRQP